jgi:hypothetical protein
MKKYYLPVRALHLYIGLFISPFILIFAISVLVFDHQQFVDKIVPVKDLQAVNVKLDSIPIRGTDLLTARAIMKKLDIKGEADYVTKNDSSFSFPVRTPGILSKITANMKNGMVRVTPTDQGVLRGTTYMHSMPGPHNAMLRGNSGFMKVWRYLVDTTVYFLLFLTISGVFLWYFLPSERKLGIYAAGLGILILLGLILITF